MYLAFPLGLFGVQGHDVFERGVSFTPLSPEALVMITKEQNALSNDYMFRALESDPC